MANIDPFNFEPVRKVMNKEKTFNEYKKTWREFCLAHKITIEKQPCEKDFEDFFDSKRAKGLCGTSLRSMYSHLNKFMVQLYSQRLGVNCRRYDIF